MVDIEGDNPIFVNLGNVYAIVLYFLSNFPRPSFLWTAVSLCPHRAWYWKCNHNFLSLLIPLCTWLITLVYTKSKWTSILLYLWLHIIGKVSYVHIIVTQSTRITLKERFLIGCVIIVWFFKTMNKNIHTHFVIS